MSRRRLSRAGFTILEILIAIVVLVLGITGIIALFPTAIESGNKTVEDSYAAAITQSVVDAITVGIRESRYAVKPPGSPVTYTYFIFNHDGVIDPAPLQPGPDYFSNGAGNDGQGAIWRRDYCVILPTAKAANPASNTNVQNEPNFIYPVPTLLDPEQMLNDSSRDGDPALNQRKPSVLANPGTLVDNLDVFLQRDSTSGNAKVPWISRVYHLGRYRKPPGNQALPTIPGGTSQMQPGDVRLEYLGETVTVAGSQQLAVPADPYPSYGFAFTLQRARVDTSGATPNVPDGRLTSADLFSDSLFTLRVMIFKNFDDRAAYELRPNSLTDPSPANAGASAPRSNIRIREFVTLIAL